ncbi:hypothetical protein BV898_05161 [Hypsibius exemplaris]|uniref:Uncharacterized protein n=1 Tax=Hypsibius exemplaris TaxID=2072580 RepID=A0A1W0X061_HYPEX|nr:hypothetical protein BV898_05161 [Hypsibius exemplaris]
MAAVPFCGFSAGRVHSELATQRKKMLEQEDACILDPLGCNARPPALATYILKNGQMFTQATRTNPDGSTSCFAVPVDDLQTNKATPSVLIRSDKFDPTSLTQKETKPIPSQSSPGVGPRKG